MCGSCHTINLPVVDQKPMGHNLEQLTYLEWLNSSFQNGTDPAIWDLKFGASLELGIWNLELLAQCSDTGRSALCKLSIRTTIWNLFTFSAAAGLILSAT